MTLKEGYLDTDYRGWLYEIRKKANYNKDNAISKPDYKNGQCTRCGKWPPAGGEYYISCRPCFDREMQIEKMDEDFAKIIGGC